MQPKLYAFKSLKTTCITLLSVKGGRCCYLDRYTVDVSILSTFSMLRNEKLLKMSMHKIRTRILMH